MSIDWKFVATGYLRDHACKMESLAGIQEEIKHRESEMTSIRSATADSSHVNGGGSRQEERMLSNIVLWDELKKNLKDTREEVHRVKNALTKLSQEDKMLLDRFYIHRERGAAERIAGELGIDVKTVQKRKINALRNFTILMYGRPES